MTALRLQRFAAEHVEAAAALLDERHRRHREAEPLLPRLEDARLEVERLFGLEGTYGSVALRNGAVVGYLVGRVRDDPHWGTHAWVDLAGHAAKDPEVVRDLYAAAAAGWAEEGARLHLARVPALAALADPWFRLGFGHMQVHGIRRSGSEPDRPAPSGVTIRPGSRDDLAAARPLWTLIWEHQRLSPTFTGFVLPPEAEIAADWEDTLAEPKAAYFVAERDGRIVGHALLYPHEPDLASPAGSIYLAVAATLPEARGLGVGVALTDRVLSWASEAGYEIVVTDWRQTNLLASHFWPRRGFRETFYRLHRVIESG